MENNISDWEKFCPSADTSDITNREINVVSSTSSQIHYESVFEEISQIGRGGFGYVFRVQNKIDDEYYAVKKILLSGK
jgi:serine/threonine protein kinase